MAYPVFDLHCDTADMLALGHLRNEYKPMIQDVMEAADAPEVTFHTATGHLSRTLVGSTPWAQCFACFVPDPVDPEMAAGFCHAVFDHLDREISDPENELADAKTAGEIRPALAQGKTVVVKTIENAKMFAYSPALVHEYAERGVLMASLSWNGANPLASGHGDEESRLTDLGRQVLRLMEEEHIILDVSHLNDASFEDIVACATRPFVASHSNSRACCPHLRGLTDAQFVEIRDRGGIVGFNYANDFIVDTTSEPNLRATFDDMSRHIEHWLDLDGEDVLALGSDFDGCDTPDFLEGADKLPALQKQLVARFGETITRKMCAENALAFFEHWGR